MTSALRAWIVSLFAFREANHSSVVTAMKAIESPQPVKPPVFILTPRREITLDWWLLTYAPDHKGSA